MLPRMLPRKMLFKRIAGGLFIPGLAILLAGAFALAEVNDGQQALPSATPQPLTEPAEQAPNTAGQPEGVPMPEADREARTEPVKPEKRQKAKKVKKELDPVSEGKMLFETRCNTCHTVPNTNVHTMAEWPECIRRMAARSYLRDSEVGMIVQYLEHELKPAAQPSESQN